MSIFHCCMHTNRFKKKNKTCWSTHREMRPYLITITRMPPHLPSPNTLLPRVRFNQSHSSFSYTPLHVAIPKQRHFLSPQPFPPPFPSTHNPATQDNSTFRLRHRLLTRPSSTTDQFPPSPAASSNSRRHYHAPFHPHPLIPPPPPHFVDSHILHTSSTSPDT